MRKLELFAIASLLLVATAANAGWQDRASRFDAQRLSRLDESRAKGLNEAQGAPAADLAVIRSVLDAQAVAASPSALQGTWRCRTIKLGGITPDIIYSWFNCRISPKGGALAFEKLTGSQRSSGLLYPEGGGFVYLGASYVTGEKPNAYSGNGAEAGAAATPDDQIGYLSLLADGRARIEFPYPLQESTFDVLELKR
ncbi:MAG TPA: DUF4893 domain-containing protein [Rhizomicrobium sp.]